MEERDFKEPLRIGDAEFRPGERGSVDVPVGYLIHHEKVSIPVTVVRGKRPGPCLLLCAALHGDEVNGVEIIRRLLRMRAIKRLRGDLLAVPVVNLPAFLARSRYLPDRRDLNRLFPGAAMGSLGARMARVFLDEITAMATHIVDFHTGAQNRPNLAQLRISNQPEENVELAKAFGAPVTLLATNRVGTFREIASRVGKPMLMFEGGEALRLDPTVVRFGLRGITGVMRHLGMLKPQRKPPKHPVASVLCKRSHWERSPRGGIFQPRVRLGSAVSAGDVLATVSDPFGDAVTPVVAKQAGIVIGRTNEGVADEGDGVFHIALTKDPESAQARIEKHEAQMLEDQDRPVRDDPLVDE